MLRTVPTTQQIHTVPKSPWLGIGMWSLTMVQKRYTFSKNYTLNFAPGSFPWIRLCATISSNDAESQSLPVIHVTDHQTEAAGLWQVCPTFQCSKAGLSPTKPMLRDLQLNYKVNLMVQNVTILSWAHTCSTVLLSSGTRLKCIWM